MFAVVAQEYAIGNDVRANLQLCQRIVRQVLMALHGLQGGTVTADIDGSADNGFLFFGSSHLDGHLLGIGTDAVQGFDRGGCAFLALRVDEIAVDIVVHHVRHVSVGIGAIAAAIHIAADAGTNTDGIAEVDLASHVVTAVHIVDVAALYDEAGCQIGRERVAADYFVDIIDIHVLARCHIPSHRPYVGHAAAAVEVVDDEGRAGRNLQEQALLVNHTAAVAAAVEVTHLAALQVPGGTDGHVGLVVAAEETANLERVAAGVGVADVDAHVLETGHGEQLCLVLNISNGVDDLAGVIDTDDRFLRHCGIVAASVCIDDRAAV